MNTPLSALRWRYATKSFDPQKKIPENVFQDLLDALVLSASSYGLQPWKFFVVKNPQIRESLKPHAWGQSQITSASHLIVLASKLVIDEAYVDSFVADIAKTRGVDTASLKGYRDMMVGAVNRMSDEIRAHWAQKQVYLALGNLLLSAAEMGLDTCPMEGFVPEKFDEILGLKEKGYTSVLVCPVGYRAEDDEYAQMKKVRFTQDAMVEVIS